MDAVVESPPLQRVKAITELSEASESSSVNSQGWDDLGKSIICSSLIFTELEILVILYSFIIQFSYSYCKEENGP